MCGLDVFLDLDLMLVNCNVGLCVVCLLHIIVDRIM